MNAYSGIVDGCIWLIVWLPVWLPIVVLLAIVSKVAEYFEKRNGGK